MAENSLSLTLIEDGLSLSLSLSLSLALLVFDRWWMLRCDFCSPPLKPLPNAMKERTGSLLFLVCFVFRFLYFIFFLLLPSLCPSVFGFRFRRENETGDRLSVGTCRPFWRVNIKMKTFGSLSDKIPAVLFACFICTFPSFELWLTSLSALLVCHKFPPQIELLLLSF